MVAMIPKLQREDVVVECQMKGRATKSAPYPQVSNQSTLPAWWFNNSDSIDIRISNAMHLGVVYGKILEVPFQAIKTKRKTR